MRHSPYLTREAARSRVASFITREARSLRERMERDEGASLSSDKLLSGLPPKVQRALIHKVFETEWADRLIKELTP